MFGKTLCTFKAQIKPGAKVFQDHSVFKWPQLYRPAPADLVFDGEYTDSGWFDLTAHGYGKLNVKDGYGSGSISTHSIDDLLLDATNHRKVMAAIKARLVEQRGAMQSELDKKELEIAKLDAAIAAIP